MTWFGEWVKTKLIFSNLRYKLNKSEFVPSKSAHNVQKHIMNISNERGGVFCYIESLYTTGVSDVWNFDERVLHPYISKPILLSPTPLPLIFFKEKHKNTTFIV